MRWTLDQLRTFVTVAEFGTMTAAAAALDYTTGAVSQQMAALSAAVDRSLFARDGTRLALTDDGLLLLAHARTVLEADRRAGEALRGPAVERSAVRLGVFGSVAVWSMPRLRAALAAESGPVALRAIEVDVEAMPEAVLADEIDLALGLNYCDAPLPPRRGLDVLRLHEEPYRMVLPEPVTFEDAEALRAYADRTDWIVPPPTSNFGKAVRFACTRAGIVPREQHIVTDTAVSIALAESGVGITLITPLMLEIRATRAPTVALPGPSTRDVVALTRTANLQRRSIAAVRSALARVFREA